MDDYDNITQRRQNTHNKNMTSSDSEFDMDVSYQSLPTVVGNSNDIAIMTEEIEKLRLELQIANSEIDNLNLENNKLKSNLLDCGKKIKLLKSIGIQESSNKENISRQFYSPQYQRRVRTLLMKTGLPRTSSREYTIQALNLISPKADVLHNSVTDKNNFPGIDERQAFTSDPSVPLLSGNLQDSVLNKSFLNFTNGGSCENDESVNLSHTPVDELTDDTPCTRNTFSRDNIHKKTKKRVMILCNEQGNGLRQSLSLLLGSDYAVFSFIKSGTTLRNLINSSKNEIAKFSMNDFVIVVGGRHERNPYDTEMYLHTWLSSITNTNIIISEVPSNRYLNEAKLNYMLRFICGKYDNVIFMDMDYSRYRPRRAHFIINLSRSLLREILQMDYKFKSKEYKNLLTEQNKKIYVDKSVQTDITNHTNEIENFQKQSANKSPSYNNQPLKDNIVRSDLFRE